MTEKELEELRGLGIEVEEITAGDIFKVHMINISVAVVMMLIGAILLFKTRKEKSSGKKTAGWILLGLGFTVTVVHVIQMFAG